MNPVSLVTSQAGLSMVMLLCRVLPRQATSSMVARIARRVAYKMDIPFISALWSNMAVVYGLPERDPRVGDAVAHLLRNAMLSYTDLFRLVMAGQEAACSACQFDANMIQNIERCLLAGRGVVLVGAHTCGFDLLMLGLGRLFPGIQILSGSDPKGSSCVMNDMRARHGLEVTPISTSSLRAALRRLCTGGIVAIAADTPIESGLELEFFGRPARLPAGYARLALISDAEIMVGISHRDGEGCYRAEARRVPQPALTGRKREDVVSWAQEVLYKVEALIRTRPTQWLIPAPVWEA